MMRHEFLSGVGMGWVVLAVRQKLKEEKRLGTDFLVSYLAASFFYHPSILLLIFPTSKTSYRGEFRGSIKEKTEFHSLLGILEVCPEDLYERFA